MHLSRSYGVDITKGLELVNESILFVAGNVLIVHNTETHTQNFLTCQSAGSKLSCFTVSQNQRYIATAEFANDRSSISVWDVATLKRKKTFSASEFTGTEITFLTFSPDTRALIVITGSPDHSVCYCIWEKGKVSASIKTLSSPNSSPSYASCNTACGDGSTFLVCGQGVFRVLRYTPGDLSLRIVYSGLGHSKRDNQHITCAEWISDDQIIVGTNSGELYMVHHGEYKYTISDAPLDMPILRIFTTSKGFGISNSTSCFVVSSSGHVYDSSGVDLFLPFSKKDLAEVTRGRVFFYDYGNTGSYVNSNNLIVNGSQNFKILDEMSVSAVVLKILEKYGKSVSIFDFHPSNHFVAVSTLEGLKICLITTLDLIEIHSLSEYSNVIALKFSNCGNFLACSVKSTVVILSFSASLALLFDHFSSLSFKSDLPPPLLTTSLRAHTGTVLSLCWSSDNSTIYSGGDDGALFKWVYSEFNWKRAQVYYFKSSLTKALDVVVSSDNKYLYVSCSDCFIRCLYEMELSSEVAIESYPVRITTFQSNLIVGTYCGSLKSFSLPLRADSITKTSPLHSKPIMALFSNLDDSSILSVSSDASLFFSQLTTSALEGASKRSLFGEIVFTTPEPLIECRQENNTLETQIQVQNQSNFFEYELRKEGFALKLREKEEELTKELNQESSQFDSLSVFKNQIESDRETTYNKMTKLHNQTLAQMKDSFEARAIHDQELEEKLINEIEEIQKRFSENMIKMRNDHKSLITRLMAEFVIKKQEDEAELERLNKMLSGHMIDHDVDYSGLETSIDQKGCELLQEFTQKIGIEKVQVAELLRENEALKQQYDENERKLGQKRLEVENLNDVQEKHLSEIEKIQREKASLAREIKERNNTIEEKELRALDLKKKNQELTKFRFVLNFKIEELHQELQPYQDQIQSFLDQINQMEDELASHQRRFKELKIKSQDQKLRLNAALTQSKNHQKSAKVLSEELNLLNTDLSLLLNLIDNPKALKEGVLAIYRYYVTRESFVPGSTPSCVLSTELVGDRTRLLDLQQRNVAALEIKREKLESKFRADRSRLLQEQGMLMETLNELRRELMGYTIKSKANSEPTSDQLLREIQMQKVTLSRLQDRVDELEKGSFVGYGVRSKSKLPPLTPVGL
ncbi:hypothetical protein RCL1_001699 [Eukaryota sp. TZLM3-RCL]